jgi:DNA-binding NarL/FixJ family response regulator
MIDIAIPSEVLMDIVGALRRLGATITLPPELAEAARPNGPAPNLEIGTTQLPFGQALTDTETQVLGYLPTHLTVQEIARELCRSTDTIKTHVRHLYIKLDAHNRNEAVQIARSWGLVAASGELSRRESLIGLVGKTPGVAA